MQSLEIENPKTDPPAPRPRPTIIQKLIEHFPILGFKTEFDKTDVSCLENIVRGFVKPFITFFGIKALISLIKAIIQYKKQLILNPLLLIKAIVNVDNIKFGSFFGSLTALLKVGIVLGRVLRKKDDGWNAFLGGLIAGWVSLFFFGKPARIFPACFMLTNACDSIYNHFAEKGTFKRTEFHHVAWFAIMSAILGYIYAREIIIWGPGGLKDNDRSAYRFEPDRLITFMREDIGRMMTLGTGVKQNQ